ncbi:hypothetical protein EK21DRAFT_117619 [Setomelanomma holmii]|uniref:Uncharacterized protein n=1 Tax=Setomelanomma holmii TaxID=210430 RepID=A0A9P4H0P2_9PLEO|nr:hypothetical protein EK21DRAFT_117619 [Setomelanomma holmii]
MPNPFETHPILTACVTFIVGGVTVYLYLYRHRHASHLANSEATSNPASPIRPPSPGPDDDVHVDIHIQHPIPPSASAPASQPSLQRTQYPERIATTCATLAEAHITPAKITLEDKIVHDAPAYLGMRTPTAHKTPDRTALVKYGDAMNGDVEAQIRRGEERDAAGDDDGEGNSTDTGYDVVTHDESEMMIDGEADISKSETVAEGSSGEEDDNGNGEDGWTAVERKKVRHGSDEKRG